MPIGGAPDRTDKTRTGLKLNDNGYLEVLFPDTHYKSPSQTRYRLHIQWSVVSRASPIPFCSMESISVSAPRTHVQILLKVIRAAWGESGPYKA